ncbi:MAG: YHYH protein [Paraglaciecola sp.]|uniref:YHYH protein n=3 Tax=Paraglaciecola sp. TaxID=1920173 RepID=UPI0032977460
MNKLPIYAGFLASAISLALTGCSDGTNNTVDDVIEDVIEDSDDDAETSDDSILSVDTSLFASDSLVSVETVDCTLSNGTETSCYSITVSGFPADRTELGDFCPDTIEATADEGGKWFDDGVLYDLTGSFIENLDVFYGDSYWQLYDEDTGLINITDTQVACEAAAQPQVEAQYYNHCVQCDLDYFADEVGGGVASTYLIPVTPVFRSSAGNLSGNTGVALNGVNMAAAAPTEAILSAYTIAAFDDCVGHVNPVAGYHYHGANHGDGDCPAIAFEVDGHAGMIGYAMDGFAIYGMLDENGDEATDLDSCRGQTDDVRGYHYHSAGPGENTFIGCFSGETAN